LQTIPYDGTRSWRKGADEGPDAFCEAGENMELFDIHARLEVGKQGIPQAPNLSCFISIEDILANVYPSVITFLKDEKYATIFGIEHAVSIDRICALGDHFLNFGVFQIVAHEDLRSEYQGSTRNHACPVYEASQKYGRP